MAFNHESELESERTAQGDFMSRLYRTLSITRKVRMATVWCDEFGASAR